MCRHSFRSSNVPLGRCTRSDFSPSLTARACAQLGWVPANYEGGRTLQDPADARPGASVTFGVVFALSVGSGHSNLLSRVWGIVVDRNIPIGTGPRRQVANENASSTVKA